MRPRIYVACLAAYNAGRLHGEWIDADQDPEDIQEEIDAMLKASPEPDAEEWAIHDADDFGGYSISEFESLENVSRIAEGLIEYGEIFAAILDHEGDDVDRASQMMTDGYRGEWDSLENYAAELIDDCCEVPDFISNYIDYASFARDLEIGGDVFTLRVGFRVHVFDGTL